MEVQDVHAPLTNKIAFRYVEQDDEVAAFFDYPAIEKDKTYQMRIKELSNRQFPRESLVRYLLQYHKKFNADEKTFENINKLLNPKSVVVIGGQQAGLLTGPLYTIHKIISILKFAHKQEKLLKVPVLPVFWVAGEDHDFAEINHAFVLHEGRIEKRPIKQKNYHKLPASSLSLDKQLAKSWINEIVSTFEETVHTKNLLERLNEDINNSDTYVDFFINLVFTLFKGHGLIVVDSGDQGFRKIGASFTETMIHQNGELAENVLKKQLTVKELGYGEPIEMNENNAHLFYLQNGERVLLERDNGLFVGKNKECQFEESELLAIIKEKPELVSNNVVTRPLMQEYVFPTLAFISGPGEIAYWAVLKEAFHLFGFKVPPVIPRLMMSIIDRRADKYLRELGLNIEQMIQHGCEKEKESWLKKQPPYPIDQAVEEVLAGVMKAHQPLKELAKEIDANLTEIAEKNALMIQSQIHFLKKKMEKKLRFKHKVELDKFDYLNYSLKPLGAPQERVWNIFCYLNLYGYHFIEELIALDYEWNHQHKLIFV
ncbi:MAG TPA: bacillithiol biosynthesis cysteine-adding enzyme BshC [Bacillus bacterium]|nr:bacillithiol biosynthesis cysteine-adding enzyme BshC [Bacillus sp. (in: firmicutes)]